MTASASLMMWAQRVIGKRRAEPHELLEIKADATVEDAQVAFHKLARVAHPDLHRNTLAPDELELLNAAYAIVAGAYQSYRAQSMSTQRMKPLKPEDVARPVAATPAGAAPTTNAAQSMSSKAIVYYRKAELALKRGDLKSAMLQIKLAIAADPSSGFLRSALVEVELELKKG